jgi:Zn-dependent protease
MCSQPATSPENSVLPAFGGVSVFEHRWTLFNLFGFGVRVDLSWLILALLVTWSLAKGLFPHQYPELSVATYWLMGVLGALGLFVSIVFHEFCHSLVARRYGLPMKGITLFVFGGIAEMGEEPRTPKIEFLMAAAGPVASFLLALLFYLVWTLGNNLAWSDLANGITGYLAFINVLLAVFNLLPAFPLDGGRILRSALWQWQGDLRRATRSASRIGAGFGVALMLFGLFNAFGGNLIGGLWYFLIGLFLRGAARMTYQQLLLRLAFEGQSITHLMNPAPVQVSPDISLRELIEDHLPRHLGKTFPVVEQGWLIGCAPLARIKQFRREDWAEHQVREILQPCPETTLIKPDADVLQALSHMQKLNLKHLLVVDDQKLLGSLALADILSAYAAWMELESET